MNREIVKIDEEKCDGCGLCVPSCHEGAIAMVNGKAKLSSDQLCDGLGDCLGHCPQGAITIERREAEEYDEALVQANLAAAPAAAAPQGGCPGSRQMSFQPPQRLGAPALAGPATGAASELSHWPVQISLLPPTAPVLRGARLLIAADCVPIAYPNFHAHLLRGRTVMIGCPKFDDLNGYVHKLTEVIRHNQLREICVARMEVPCCIGIVQAVLEGRQRAGSEVQVSEVIVGVRGDILAEREHGVESAA